MKKKKKKIKFLQTDKDPEDNRPEADRVRIQFYKNAKTRKRKHEYGLKILKKGKNFLQLKSEGDYLWALNSCSKLMRC